MKHLSAIAREIGIEVSALKALEARGHFAPCDSNAEGHLYNPRQVLAAVGKTSPLAPSFYFSRLKQAVEFITEAKTPETERIRKEAVRYVFNGVNAETKADVAKRLGITRTHFSLVCSRFAELTLLT